MNGFFCRFGPEWAVGWILAGGEKLRNKLASCMRREEVRSRAANAVGVVLCQM